MHFAQSCAGWALRRRRIRVRLEAHFEAVLRRAMRTSFENVSILSLASVDAPHRVTSEAIKKLLRKPRPN